MIGKIVGVLVTGLVGILCVVLGFLIWKKEKITLLHEYHTDKVAPENRKAFCTMAGIGVFAIGVSLFMTAAAFAFSESAYSFLCFAAGLLAGVILLAAAEAKYNR